MLEQSYLAPDHIKTHAYLLVNDLIGLREHDRIQHLDDPPLHRGQRILGLIRVPHALLRHPQVKLAQRGHGPGCWPGTVSVAKGSNEIPAPRRLFQKRTRPASGRCAPLKRRGRSPPYPSGSRWPRGSAVPVRRSDTNPSRVSMIRSWLT